MSKKVIEVFVRNTEVPVGTFRTFEFSTPGHECPRRPIVAPIFESVLPENHRQAVGIAERLARERGMKLKTHNISTRMGKIRAFLKGVRETPAIIVGNHKISEEITEKRLVSLME